MKKYLFIRVLEAIPLLFAISIICFALINLIPSDPVEVTLRVRQIPVITEELVEETRKELGLDKPIVERYFSWLKSGLKGDFGISYINPNRTVMGEISRSLPPTLKLAGISLIIVIITSIPIGILCSVFKDTLFDRIIRLFIFMTSAMPSYWIGIVLMWVISVKLKILPTSGSGSLKHIILPGITVSLTYISTYIRLIRNNMIENMKEDYVVYGKVRGLKNNTIIINHVLKNSIHSCITAFGMSIPQLISGTIVVENVFAWPGLGTLCISAIFNRDYPIIQTYVLLMGVLFVVFNLIFDLIQGVTDPRIRGGESSEI